MSDAAYFSAFSESPLETYARRLKSIDRKKNKKTEKKERKREEEKNKNRKTNFIIPLSKIHLDVQY